MVEALQSPAQATYWLIHGQVLFVTLNLLGIACFSYIVARRLTPLFRGNPDVRLDRPLVRLQRVAKYWFGQWKHPRYRVAGTIHILIFGCFILLAIRAFALLILGMSEGFASADSPGGIGHIYGIVTDYCSTIVFACMVAAATRRIVFKPPRYEVPPKYGKSHKVDAIFLLVLIAILMLSESLFEASRTALLAQQGHIEFLSVLSLPWVLQNAFSSLSSSTLWNLHRGAYILDVLTFYFLLCYPAVRQSSSTSRPRCSTFTSPSWIRAASSRSAGASADEHLDQVKSFGVKTFEDFTWKHMLDFYSCADCGRCSDNCPGQRRGQAVVAKIPHHQGERLRLQHYPLFGSSHNGDAAVIGGIYSEDEIWSCTTCGACEEECPLMLEYIDKIVDLRRGMIDDGQRAPVSAEGTEGAGEPRQSLRQDGKEKADWAKAKEFQQTCSVKILDGQELRADTLYFVDSITSYDDRMQSIGRATARILDHVGEIFGILGAAEKDSGHEVRRFGEETLFMALRDHNSEAIKASGVQADCHRRSARLQRAEDMTTKICRRWSTSVSCSPAK